MNICYDKIKIKIEENLLLLGLVAGVVPVVPAAVGHQVVEVSVGVDDPRVLAHGPADVEWATSGHLTAHESKARLLVRPFPVVRRYRPESRRYGVQLAVLGSSRAAIYSVAMNIHGTY